MLTWGAAGPWSAGQRPREDGWPRERPGWCLGPVPCVRCAFSPSSSRLSGEPCAWGPQSHGELAQVHAEGGSREIVSGKPRTHQGEGGLQLTREPPAPWGASKERHGVPPGSRFQALRSGSVGQSRGAALGGPWQVTRLGMGSWGVGSLPQVQGDGVGESIPQRLLAPQGGALQSQRPVAGEQAPGTAWTSPQGAVWAPNCAPEIRHRGPSA